MVRPYIDETKVMDLAGYRPMLEEEDHESFDDFAERARLYVERFSWCDELVEVKVGLFFPAILGVFLVEIKSSRPEVDELIWAVVGDLPPAYMAGEEPTGCPNAACALDGYVGAMMNWVEAVEEGRTVEDLIPVNVPPTKEWAKELRSRLTFIDEEILPDYRQFIN